MAKNNSNSDLSASIADYEAVSGLTTLYRLFLGNSEVYRSADPLKKVVDEYFPDANATNIRSRVTTVAQRLGMDSKVIDRLNTEWRKRYRNRASSHRSYDYIMRKAIEKAEEVLYS